MTIRTLIVDDEALARRGLRLLLKKEPDIDIVGEARDGPTAVAAITTLKPHLVLLDVQMPGFDGFHVLEEVSSVHMPALVFVTAHDRYAVRAFKAHAIDYLLKPIDEERLQDALQRVRVELEREEAIQDRHQRVSEIIDSRASGDLDAKPGHLRRLVVKEGERFVLLKVEEIDWCESAANYVRVHARSKSFLVRMTMSELEQRLDPETFIRTHRSIVVNSDRIREISPSSHGDFDLRLKDGTTIRLSRSYRDRLLPP
jgi:two-component system LytT family response regulator